MSMIQPLGQIRQTRFVDVKPGSKVRYSRPDGQEPSFDASVLEVKQDWGASAIPAHIFRREGSAEAELMPANGTWTVEILVDSGILANEIPSANVIRAVRRATEVTAIRFVGGVDSAMEVIRFGGGKVNLSWRDASPQGDEAIILARAEGDLLLPPGDYLVLENDKAAILSSNNFLESYVPEELVDFVDEGPAEGPAE